MLACFGKARSERRRNGRDGKALLQTVPGHAYSTWALATEGKHSLGHLDLSSGAKLVLTHLSGTILEAKAYVQLLASWIVHDLYFANLLECFHKQVQRQGAPQPRTFILKVLSSCDKPSCGVSMKLRVHVTHLQSLTLEHLPHEENSFSWEFAGTASGSNARVAQTDPDQGPACSDFVSFAWARTPTWMAHLTPGARPETGVFQGWHQANGDSPEFHACSAFEHETGKATAAATAPPPPPSPPPLLLPPPSPLQGPAALPLPPPQLSPLQGPAAQDHRRSALMLLEVPASITLLSKDLLVLDQNQGSIEQYGPIIGEKMWRAKNVDGKAVQELPGDCGDFVHMSGPLPALYGPSSADILRDLLECVHQSGTGPWRCIIPVGPRASAPPALTANPHDQRPSRSLSTLANESQNRESGCATLQPQKPSLLRPSSTLVKSNRLASQMNLRDRASCSFTCQPQKSRGVCKQRSSSFTGQPQSRLQQDEQQLHAVSVLDALEEVLQQQQPQQQQQKLQLQARSDESGMVLTAKGARGPNTSMNPSHTLSDLKATNCGGLPPMAKKDLPRAEAAGSCKSSPRHGGPKRRHTFQALQFKQLQKQQQQQQQVKEVQQSCIRSPLENPSSLTSWSSQSRVEGTKGPQRPRTSPCEPRSSQVWSPPGVASRSKVASATTGARRAFEDGRELGPKLSDRNLSARECATPAAFPWGPVDRVCSTSLAPVNGHLWKSTQTEIESRLSKRVLREESGMRSGEDQGGEEEELDREVEHQEVEMRPVVDPVTNQPACLLIQRDVTEQAKLERMLLQMTEDQLQMLSQIFPRHIIEALSTGVLTTENLAAMAKQHADVTILFADIVGFTSMSKDVHAEEVILFLNLLFSRFDRLLVKHQMQKIDTIGDCFIASSGILAPDEDGFMSIDELHNPTLGAGQALALAIDMMHTAAQVQMPNKEPVQLRIGIHTGPCVSGLMGIETPKWSVFGDTVNTAARMEQTAESTCIQISRATYDFIPKHVGVELKPSGGVAVKGKGVMETWVWRSPSDWASTAGESSGSAGRLPLSAERLYQQSLDETGEPSHANSSHHRATNRSTVTPLTDLLAASMLRYRHTRTSSTMTSSLPSDTGFAPTASSGRFRKDSLLNLQGLVMLVGGNNSGTGFAPYASQKSESDGYPPTPFAVMPQGAGSSGEGPSKASTAPPPPPVAAAETQAAAPAAAAAGAGVMGIGAFESTRAHSGAAETVLDVGAERMDVLGTQALEAGSPVASSSETGAHVLHTLADMPSRRHMASSSVLPSQHAIHRDLEDPDNHGLAISPGNDDSRQAEIEAGTSVLVHTLQPQLQHHHNHHLQQNPSTGGQQQQQAGDLDHNAAAPFPPQPQALSSNSSSWAPSLALQEESQSPGFAFPHIVLPLHDIHQAELTPSYPTPPSCSLSSRSPTHVLCQQHHRDHPQQPPTPQTPASTASRPPKKPASFLSQVSWASGESRTEARGGKSAGLPKLDSSNAAGTTQDSIQCSGSVGRHNSFLQHLPASSVVHTHAALLDAELAQHRRRKSMPFRPKVQCVSSFYKPPSTSPRSSQAPSAPLPLLALSQRSVNPPLTAGPEALHPGKDIHAVPEMQAGQPSRGHAIRRIPSHGVRATAATLAQRAMAHAARPGRMRPEGRYHRSCSNVILPPHASCSNAVPPHQNSVLQGYAGGSGGVAYVRSHTSKCGTIINHSSNEWDMRRPGSRMA